MPQAKFRHKLAVRHEIEACHAIGRTALRWHPGGFQQNVQGPAVVVWQVLAQGFGNVAATRQKFQRVVALQCTLDKGGSVKLRVNLANLLGQGLGHVGTKAVFEGFGHWGVGAGDGNRTHVICLGSRSSTIELHPLRSWSLRDTCGAR